MLFLLQRQLIAADPLIGKVGIEYVGLRNVTEEVVQSHIKVHQGMPYNPFLVDQSIRSLYESGFFDEIKAKQEEMPNKEVAVTFFVTPKIRVQEIAFDGNKKIRSKTLIDKIDTKEEKPLDEAKIKSDVNKLIEFYQKKGYFQATVSYSIEKTSQEGLGKVIFHVKEGQCFKISKVKIEGHAHVKDSKIKENFKTKAWHIFSWLTGSGYFQESTFREDLDKAREVFKNEGFLDVEISEADVKFEYPKAGRLTIVVHVKENKQYFVGDVKIQGNTLHPTDKLIRLLRIIKNKVFSPAVVEGDCETLRNYFGKDGYLETQVQAIRIPNTTTGNIDLTYDIHESQKIYVQDITVQGNTKTKTKVIVRELALSPGDVFDLVRMKNSQARLENLRYFDEVSVTPETTSIPNRKNLRITVKEGRTGSIGFGGGFSTQDKFSIFVDLGQGNFDIKNPRSFFQGAGQKFRIHTSLGSKVMSGVINFEEPWIFDHRLAFGTELFASRSKYSESKYNELRKGVELYFRKRLFELVEGRLSYRIEDVKIYNVDATAPETIRDSAGKRSVSKVGFSLSRCTYDNFIYQTEGSNIALNNEIAGGPVLRGQTYYTRHELSGGQAWTVCEAGKQVLLLGAKTGTVIPFGHKQVPIFERYFLGGESDMCGFDYREVGPKANDADHTPLGGNTFSYANAEYSIKIFDPVRFATFYDIGYVNERSGRWYPHGYNCDWGFGLRIFILGAPLRLDLGFPIRGDKYNKHSCKFNFSFGTKF